MGGLSSKTELVEFQEGGSNLPPLKIAGKLRYALFDQANREVARWAIVNAWPSKTSIEIDENSGEPVEVIVLAVDASHRQ